MSTVKSSDNLQIINFHRKFLLSQPSEVVNLASNTCLGLNETYLCCRYQRLDDCHFMADDSVTIFHEEQSSETDTNEIDYIDEEIEDEEFFETSKEPATCKLEGILLCLIPHFETELSTPPSTFSMETFLVSAIANRTDSYSEAINAAANYAINNLETFKILGNILWCRVASLFEQHLADNQETVNLTNKDFTLATSQVHELFLSHQYRKGLTIAFGVGY